MSVKYMQPHIFHKNCVSEWSDLCLLVHKSDETSFPTSNFRQYCHTSEFISNPMNSKSGLVGPTYLHSDVTPESWVCTKTLRNNILRSTIFEDICFCMHVSAEHFLIWMTLAIQSAARWYRKFSFRFLVKGTHNPQHLDCGRSIPATREE